MTIRRGQGVAVTPDARAVLKDYGITAGELGEAWAQETDEMLVLTRGERAVVLVFEEGGILQLCTPQDVKNLQKASAN